LHIFIPSDCLDDYDSTSKRVAKVTDKIFH